VTIEPLDPWAASHRIIELNDQATGGTYLIQTLDQTWLMDLQRRFLVSLTIDKQNPGQGSSEEPLHFRAAGSTLGLIELMSCVVGQPFQARISTSSHAERVVTFEHAVLAIVKTRE
jgi:hypothetical protein